MSAHEILTLNLKEDENNKKLLKRFKKTSLYETLEDKKDTSELKSKTLAYIKKRGYDMIELYDYNDGAKSKLISYDDRKMFDVVGNSLQEELIKITVYVSLMKEGKKK